MATLDDLFDAERLFDRAQIERARRYLRPLYLAAAAGIALNLGLLALLSFTVVGEHVYGVTSGWPWWARAPAYAPLVVALTAAAALPITFWAGYLHEHAWQLSTQSIGGWALDRLKGLAVSLAFGACALLGLVAGARAAGDRSGHRASSRGRCGTERACARP